MLNSQFQDPKQMKKTQVKSERKCESNSPIFINLKKGIYAVKWSEGKGEGTTIAKFFNI
jgi:hypothetical protein